jgi:Tol biopolymer transport system component
MGGTDPAFDADGEWLYYGSSTADGESRGREIWRAAPDGSGAERVGPPAAEGRYDRWPSPSPDGDRLVYASDSSGISEYDSPIRILDLETGAVRELGLSGASPAWSPAGRHIAFATDSAVMMTDPAGGGIRELVRLVRPGALAWSPDGRFLLGHYDRDPVISYYNIFVLEIETGFWLRAPLIGQTASTSRSGEVWDPAWRPTPPGS